MVAGCIRPKILITHIKYLSRKQELLCSQNFNELMNKLTNQMFLELRTDHLLLKNIKVYLPALWPWCNIGIEDNSGYTCLIVACVIFVVKFVMIRNVQFTISLVPHCVSSNQELWFIILTNSHDNIRWVFI